MVAFFAVNIQFPALLIMKMKRPDQVTEIVACHEALCWLKSRLQLLIKISQKGELNWKDVHNFSLFKSKKEWAAQIKIQAAYFLLRGNEGANVSHCWQKANKLVVSL